MACGITQVPVILSDAITGHKLQGLTKDNVIVYIHMEQTHRMDICGSFTCQDLGRPIFGSTTQIGRCQTTISRIFGFPEAHERHADSRA